MEYEHLADVTRSTSGYDSRFIVPQDITLLEESPELPPPIWDDAPGFASDEELEDMVRTLADLPPVPTQGIPWDVNWGWARHDLVRFNRVEGLAVGGRFEAEFGSFLGPVNFETSGFFGFGDLEPKAKVSFERRSVLRRVAISGYRELRPTDPQGRYLGLGNSLYSLFFGRDDGEYYMATGADLVWRPPEADRESFRFRVYAERQDSVDIDTNFSLATRLRLGLGFPVQCDGGPVGGGGWRADPEAVVGLGSPGHPGGIGALRSGWCLETP